MDRTRPRAPSPRILAVAVERPSRVGRAPPSAAVHAVNQLRGDPRAGGCGPDFPREQQQPQQERENSS